MDLQIRFESGMPGIHHLNGILKDIFTQEEVRSTFANSLLVSFETFAYP